MAAGEGFALASNPEFLRAVSRRRGLPDPWMTVIGSPRARRPSSGCAELLSPVRRRACAPSATRPRPSSSSARTTSTTPRRSASGTRCGWSPASSVSTSTRSPAPSPSSAEGSINPQYGIRGGAPYGGVCLPKDTCGFLGFADDARRATCRCCAAVVEVNEHSGASSVTQTRSRRAAEQAVADTDRRMTSTSSDYYVLGTPAGRARPVPLGMLADPAASRRCSTSPCVNDYRTADDASSSRSTRRTRMIFATRDRVLAGQRRRGGHPRHRRHRQGLPGDRRAVPGDGRDHRRPGQARRAASRAGTRRRPSWSRWSTPTPSGRPTWPREVCKPFADPRIGGVGTRQSVYGSRRACWPGSPTCSSTTATSTRTPARRLLGRAVSCLSGRTAVYRRDAADGDRAGRSWARRSGACPACPATTSG